jgi:hypothetical protein
VSKIRRVGKGIKPARRGGIGRERFHLRLYGQRNPGEGWLLRPQQTAVPAGKLGAVALCWLWSLSPMLGQSPTADATGNGGESLEPPSSSGLGHRPFKAAARVRIPLGAPAGISWQTHGPVEQLGVLATLSRWRSRVQIPSGPLGKSGGTVSPLMVR